MKSALLILAEGFEEIEAITTIDILRRSQVECTVAAHQSNKFVTGKTGIQVVADELFEHLSDKEFDLFVIPGGPGVRHLRKDKNILEYTRRHAEAGRLIGAICAGPTLLHDAGLLDGRKYTAHFSVAKELKEILSDQAVVQDMNIITSQGAGTAVEFGLHLVKELVGEKLSEEVRQSICASGKKKTNRKKSSRITPRATTARNKD